MVIMGIMGSKFLPKPEDRASRRIPQGVQRKELEHHSATSAEMPAQTSPERAAERGISLRTPRPNLCTDNGAMIAVLGAEIVAAGGKPSALDIGADSSLSVSKILI